MAKPNPNVKSQSVNRVSGMKPVYQSATTPSDRWIYVMALVVAVCGFILYANTLNHDYVLDDFGVIVENPITRSGVSGIGKIFNSSYREGYYNDESGLYRPLSRVMFAIEWQIAPGNPSLSHLVNVLMYAFTCGFIFYVLYQYLKPNYWVPLIAALIFTFHPVHTEVVANIKSRDEILALLCLAVMMLGAKRFAEKDGIMWMVVTWVSYFLALLSKESSITFIAIVPLCVYFFSKASVKQNIIISGGLVAVTALYLVIHRSVIGDVGVHNVPVVDNSLNATDSFFKQRMTAIYILGLYLKLLFFPASFSCDYSYNTVPLIESASNPYFIVAFMIHVALFVYALIGLPKKSLISFGILFYFITLSIGSNIFYIIGTNMADRLIFIPSLGFAIIIGLLLVRVFKVKDVNVFKGWGEMLKKAPVLFLLLGMVLMLYGFKTYSRNKDWKNISTLFRKDIQTVPNSAHMHLYYVGMITNKDTLANLQAINPQLKLDRINEAIVHLKKAAGIWAEFPDVYNQLGKMYGELNINDSSIVNYQRAIELAPGNPQYYNNMATIYFRTGRYDEAEEGFRKAVELSPSCYPDALCNLGSVMGTKGELTRKAGNEQQAVAFFNESASWFLKTIECDAEYLNAYKFLAPTYRSLGDEKNATIYENMANSLAIKLEQKKKKQ